jgi:hypothetical protein
LGLTPGARLGAYEVIASIGVGGMGEVFRDAVPDGRFIAVEPAQASGAASIVVVHH